jgi:hypothetical protein
MVMQDEKLQKAIDEFILQRINDCGLNETEALQEAWDKFKTSCDQLKNATSPEHIPLFAACEDTLALVDGEIVQCYYRAGFSDAVLFLLGWGNQKWN